VITEDPHAQRVRILRRNGNPDRGRRRVRDC
jgi:hypothetical protein